MIERHPQRAERHFNLGAPVSDRLDRREEGEALIHKAVEIEPGLAAKVGNRVEFEAPAKGALKPQSAFIRLLGSSPGGKRRFRHSRCRL